MLPVSGAASVAPVAGAGRSPPRSGPSFDAVLREAAQGDRLAAGAAAPPPARSAASGGVPGVHLLAAVEQAHRRLEGVLAAARSGRTFSAQELLGLQAEAYRAAQTVDLAARLVEQGAQSVRQALGTQL
jgi:hypothetical protein